MIFDDETTGVLQIRTKKLRMPVISRQGTSVAFLLLAGYVPNGFCL